MSDRLQGIFPVLQTPVRENGEVDADDLRREVDFCVAAGAHGLVFPVLGGEFQFLTDTERRLLVETVVKASDGRSPAMNRRLTCSIFTCWCVGEATAAWRRRRRSR